MSDWQNTGNRIQAKAEVPDPNDQLAALNSQNQISQNLVNAATNLTSYNPVVNAHNIAANSYDALSCGRF